MATSDGLCELAPAPGASSSADAGRLRSSSSHQDDFSPGAGCGGPRRGRRWPLAAISSPPWSGCTSIGRVRYWARTSR
jgi:hypothetical protein